MNIDELTLGREYIIQGKESKEDFEIRATFVGSKKDKDHLFFNGLDIKGLLVGSKSGLFQLLPSYKESTVIEGSYEVIADCCIPDVTIDRITEVK